MAKKYCIETRLAAVNAYLDGVESIREVAKKLI
jgi:transposase-like protein